MVGSRLRAFRIAQRLTLDDLAEASRISRGTIHRIELGQVSPRLDTLADLCRALGTDLRGFFSTPEDPGAESEPAPSPDLPEEAGNPAQALGGPGELVAYLLDREGAILQESQSARAFHGTFLAQRLGAPFWALAHPEDQASVQAAFEWLAGSHLSRITCHFRTAHRDGAWHLVQAVLGRRPETPAPVFLAELRDWTEGPGRGGGSSADPPQVRGASVPAPTRRGRPAPPAKAILLADDEPDLRESLVGLLPLIGHSQVLAAADGEETLRLFHAHPGRIGLALLDVNMPGIDGIQAARSLRSAAPGLPIVLMTGNPDCVIPVNAAGVGVANAILFKPFCLDELRSVLAKCLESGPDQPATPAAAPGKTG